MPTTAQLASDEDVPRLFAIFSAAFKDNEPFVDTMYPLHWTEAGQRAGAERFLKTKTTDPYSHYLKAVDDDGTIVGFAKWNVYDHAPAPENQPFAGPYWDHDPAVLDYANVQTPEFLARRNAFIVRNGGSCLSLDICCVDPGHQRKGAGDALVKWGLQRADEAGVETCVESSVCGRGLYLKNGFELLEQVDIPAPPEHEGREPVRFAWLIRPKQQ